MKILYVTFLVGCTGGSTVLVTGETAAEPAPITRSCGGLPSDGFMLGEAMTIEPGRVLRVSVSYGGGCEEHTFAACWNGGISKSNPATFSLSLHHDAHDDSCDALITRDVFFDLASTPEGFGSPERETAASVRLTELAN